MFELFQNFINAKDPNEVPNLLSIAFDALPVNFYWKNRRGVLLGSNDYQAKILGLNVGGDLIGHNDFDFVNEASAKHLREMFKP